MTYSWYLIEGVNPEPWTASEASIGRKNGKPFPFFHKPEQLRQYQESIKDMFKDQNPQAVKVAGDIELVFYFWRQLASIEVFESKNRRSNVADATNMQKALEDALQGILYDNDRDVKSVRSVIVEQSSDTIPGILICAGNYEDHNELSTIRATRAILQKPLARPESNDRDIDIHDIF